MLRDWTAGYVFSWGLPVLVLLVYGILHGRFLARTLTRWESSRTKEHEPPIRYEKE
jgi:hypothetical protein